MSNLVLEAKNISKSFTDGKTTVEVIKNLSLQVKKDLRDRQGNVGVKAIDQATLLFKNPDHSERLHFGDHAERSNVKQWRDHVYRITDTDPDTGRGIDADNDPWPFNRVIKKKLISGLTANSQ